MLIWAFIREHRLLDGEVGVLGSLQHLLPLQLGIDVLRFPGFLDLVLEVRSPELLQNLNAINSLLRSLHLQVAWLPCNGNLLVNVMEFLRLFIFQDVLFLTLLAILRRELGGVGQLLIHHLLINFLLDQLLIVVL